MFPYEAGGLVLLCRAQMTGEALNRSGFLMGFHEYKASFARNPIATAEFQIDPCLPRNTESARMPVVRCQGYSPKENDPSDRPAGRFAIFFWVPSLTTDNRHALFHYRGKSKNPWS